MSDLSPHTKRNLWSVMLHEARERTHSTPVELQVRRSITSEYLTAIVVGAVVVLALVLRR